MNLTTSSTGGANSRKPANRLVLVSVIQCALSVSANFPSLAQTQSPSPSESKPQAQAQPQPPSESKPRWCVLLHVLKNQQIFCDCDLESWENPPQRAEKYEYDTIISDGTQTSVVHKWIANIGDYLYQITVPIIKDYRRSERLGERSSYAVDVMRAREIGSNKIRIIVGKEELAAEKADMKDCSKKWEMGRKNWWNDPEHGERSVIQDASFCDHYLNVRIRFNSTGGAHPLHYDHAEVLNIAAPSPRKIKLREFPRVVRRRVQAQFHQEAEDRQPYFAQSDGEGDYDNFNLMRYKSACSFAFFLPHMVESARGETLDYEIDAAHGIGLAYDRNCASLISHNAKLIPWKSASDYCISPDGTSVVYTNKGRTYFKKVGGNTRQLMAKGYDSWQWFDASKLNQAARKELTLE